MCVSPQLAEVASRLRTRRSAGNNLCRHGVLNCVFGLNAEMGKGKLPGVQAPFCALLRESLAGPAPRVLLRGGQAQTQQSSLGKAGEVAAASSLLWASSSSSSSNSFWPGLVLTLRFFSWVVWLNSVLRPAPLDPGTPYSLPGAHITVATAVIGRSARGSRKCFIAQWVLHEIEPKRRSKRTESHRSSAREQIWWHSSWPLFDGPRERPAAGCVASRLPSNPFSQGGTYIDGWMHPWWWPHHKTSTAIANMIDAFFFKKNKINSHSRHHMTVEQLLSDHVRRRPSSILCYAPAPSLCFFCREPVHGEAVGRHRNAVRTVHTRQVPLKNHEGWGGAKTKRRWNARNLHFVLQKKSNNGEVNKRT